MNSSLQNKAIGDIIAESNQLDEEQVRKIIAYQSEKKVRFGEAAVALGLVTHEDVIWALSQQFKYPYALEARKSVNGELVVATRPFEAAAEFFRDVRTQLIQMVEKRTGPGAKLIVACCSPNVGDGKSFFSANLAVSFSQLGGRTLVIDGDLRNPRQHQLFGIKGEASACGLSAVLSGKHGANVVLPIPELPNLFVLPVGTVPPNPLELLQGEAFDDLLSDVSDKFDYVIIDTPAASHGSDYKVIAYKCGAAIVVAKKNHTNAHALGALNGGLSKAGINFLGTIYNSY